MSAAPLASPLARARRGGVWGWTSSGSIPRNVGRRLAALLPGALVLAGLALAVHWGFAIAVALACFQFGVVTLIRERALALTEDGWLGRASRWITTNAQSLYLGHAFAYAAVYLAVTELVGRPATATTWSWWLARPFWFVAPALVFAAGFRVTQLVRRGHRTVRTAAPALDA